MPAKTVHKALVARYGGAVRNRLSVAVVSLIVRLQVKDRG